MKEKLEAKYHLHPLYSGIDNKERFERGIIIHVLALVLFIPLLGSVSILCISYTPYSVLFT